MPLPVIKVIKQATSLLWEKRFIILRDLIGTGLVLAALDTALGRASNLLLKLLFLFAHGLIFTLFAITCHRIILLGETSVPSFGIHSWSRRETRFLGWTYVGFFYLILITMSLGMLAEIILVSFSSKLENLKGIFYLLMLTGQYVFARLAVLLPATAVGERHDMKWAWKLTSKNGWRLLIVVVFFPMSLGFVSYSMLGHNLLVDYVVNLINNIPVAIGIAALSISFLTLVRPSTS